VKTKVSRKFLKWFFLW